MTRRMTSITHRFPMVIHSSAMCCTELLNADNDRFWLNCACQSYPSPRYDSCDMEYAAIKTAAGTAELRDLTPDDTEQVVRFWYDSSDDFLDFLGIDRARLGTVEATRRRFMQAIR